MTRSNCCAVDVHLSWELEPSRHARGPHDKWTPFPFQRLAVIGGRNIYTFIVARASIPSCRSRTYTAWLHTAWATEGQSELLHPPDACNPGIAANEVVSHKMVSDASGVSLAFMTKEQERSRVVLVTVQC